MNILLQTVLDGAASAIMWYLVGFGFAYGEGDHPNGFIGDALFALARYSSHHTGTGIGNWTNWFFQWAFCATAATIPAGAVAERFNFNAYLGYSLFLGGLVYPVVVHWVWSPVGWLGYANRRPLLGTGMIDFAGSGVVHMVGGLAGLTGAAMVGPRLGRFDMDGRPVPMPGHSAILVVLGTVLLWFGWYGFNPGSALIADQRSAATLAGRAAVTTTLSGAAGGLTCLLLSVVRSVSWDLLSLCNGMLVGFVSITAGCHVLEPWAALLAGAVGAMLFEGACALLLRLRVDDVVSAGPMHGVAGAWGVLVVGLLAKEEYVMQAYARDSHPHGLFYGGGGKLLACQVIGVLAIGGWVVGTMGPFFLAFKLAGSLRISAQEEHTGLDVSKHGGSAYHMHHGGGALAGLQFRPNGLNGINLSGHADGGAASHHLHHHVQPVGKHGSVGDAVMRANTSNFINHAGAANLSGHYMPSSHHSHGSLGMTSFGGAGGVVYPMPVVANGNGNGNGNTAGGTGAGGNSAGASADPTAHSAAVGMRAAALEMEGPGGPDRPSAGPGAVLVDIAAGPGRDGSWAAVKVPERAAAAAKEGEEARVKPPAPPPAEVEAEGNVGAA
ncbi:hypothetical protein GPECTOR_6g731 [Gonium pectorale]|uniref:Ammonium transporter n=1 Tax=Gonium pectorale TaxID=33097 RepID=A0A150GVM8_GONPE|nr:hypothetical protein GPECTOR_6g731 [Gonium pectorale]|eukprot:KXZ53813.1 hypothetical protein GPECTOR_6g731 [Gonium pectorale]